jgi:signal transduction histidine kinase
MRVSLWPSGLVGRVTLVLLAAVALEFAGSTILYEQAEVLLPDNSRAQRITSQLAAAGQVLSLTPPPRRPEIADLLSTDELRLRWQGTAVTDSGTQVDLGKMRDRLLAWQPRLAEYSLHLDGAQHNAVGGPRDLLGTLRLVDGTLLGFEAAEMVSGPPVVYDTLLATAILAACVLSASVMLVRTLGSPLRTLAKAADAIGHGPPVSVAVRGPHEVRQVARAFNAMQARIAHLVVDRTQVLAAVSHDLRTPISRLRLRSGFIEDAEMQEAIEGDLNEMEAMVGSVLAYLGGETDPETPRQVDIASLLMTLIDAEVDAGRDASYHGPDHALVTLRPLEVKRAIGNLIENALKYGSYARATLECTASLVRVVVEDGGPGIPDSELERVLEPFRRLEFSRNPETGGVGLGLAIARRAVERDGGQIVLRNRPNGGLSAELSFPVR